MFLFVLLAFGVQFSTFGAVDFQGPAVTSLAAFPNPTEGASRVEVTAIVDDRGRGDSPIAACELFLDRVGFDGQGFPMSSLHGTLSNMTETAVAWVDASGWTLTGPRMVWVHGRDAGGQWGLPVGLSLQVTPLPALTLNFQAERGPLVLGSRGKRLRYVLTRAVVRASLDLSDEGGKSVRTVQGLPVTAGVQMWLWDGTGQNGKPVAPGRYQATLTVDPGEGVRRSEAVTIEVVSP